jgi:GNAT superfamily N-acetyltransferase
MQWEQGQCTIDTDRERLPMGRIVGWLQGTYWAAGRTEEAIRRSWRLSAVVFGVYDGGDLIGCARVVSDTVTHAYLADVYLVPEARGRGLGRWLLETVVAHPDLQTVGWLLHTRDAHGFYRAAGFGEPGPRVMERPRPAARRDL